MAYLLDTCAWIHTLLEPDLLSPEARNVIQKEPILHLSSISVLEAAMLHRLGRIKVNMDFQTWLESIALPADQIRVHSLDPQTASQSQNLPAPFRNAKGKIHSDPFDRVITATARLNGFTVLTSDRVLLDDPHLNTLNSRG